MNVKKNDPLKTSNTKLAKGEYIMFFILNTYWYQILLISHAKDLKFCLYLYIILELLFVNSFGEKDVRK